MLKWINWRQSKANTTRVSRTASAGRVLLGKRGLRRGAGMDWAGEGRARLGGCRQGEQRQFSGQAFYWSILHRPWLSFTLFLLCQLKSKSYFSAGQND